MIFLVNRYSSISQDEPAAWATQTKSLMAERRYPEALEYSLKLLELFPKNHIYLDQTATLYAHLGRDGDEAATLEKFLLVSPNPGDACPRLPNAYKRLGDSAKMLVSAERCLGLEPRNSDFLLQLALALERTGNSKKALELYKDGKAHYPDYTDFSIGFARLSLRLGNAELAWQEIQKILSKNPGLADAQLVAALAAMQLKKWPEARKILVSAIQQHPKYQELQDALKRVEVYMAEK